MLSDEREVTVTALRQSMIRVTPAAGAMGLLIAVYVPAFAATAWIRPGLPKAIPLVIGISLLVAMVIVGWLVRRDRDVASFGIAKPDSRSLWRAFAYGVPLAMGVAWLVRAFPHPAPFDASRLAHWQLLLYFVIATPMQEEFIFRGLIQSFLQQRRSSDVPMRALRVSLAVLFTTALFALVHLGSGWPTTLGAIALSLLAGELRRQSGSLLPAIVVHALFNIAAMPWSTG
jgi:membrane protease YdiL (CAAX protease family)